MKKELFDLQLFADGEQAEEAENATMEENQQGEQQPAKSEAKYTDADVDKLLERKYAELQKRMEKKASEAERLAKMTAEEKANERMAALEAKLRDYEIRESRANMAKQARVLLQDKGVPVSDALLDNLICDDADSTKEAAESYAAEFLALVDKRVKDALRGNVPRAGNAASGMTKEQIMAIPNRVERQKMIAANMSLFKK